MVKQEWTTTFNTSTDALQLVPGDVIAVSQQSSGVAYGYGGKIRADSPVQSSNTNVFIEHFTVPSLGAVNFNANTGPLVLRVVKLASDRIDTYILSNTKFALSTTDAVTSGVDEGILNPIKRYNPITRVWDTYTAFTSNTAPSKGDLWTFGEIEAEGDIYRAKSDKLFKVTNLDRELQDNKIKISATEYISNVYVDSDKFIDYKPTAYTDIQSSLSVPPVPNFNFSKSARRTLDGSVVVDGVLKTSTDQDGFGLTYITEYEMSKPLGESLVANANLSGVSGQVVHIEQANVFVGDINPVTLAGKSKPLLSSPGSIFVARSVATPITFFAIDALSEELPACIAKIINAAAS